MATVRLEPDLENLLRDVVDTLGLDPVAELTIKFGRLENRAASSLRWQVLHNGPELVDVRVYEPIWVHENRGSFWGFLHSFLGNRWIRLHYQTTLNSSAVCGPLRPGDWPELRDQATELSQHLLRWTQDKGLTGEPLRLCGGKAGWQASGPGWKGSFRLNPFQALSWRRE